MKVFKILIGILISFSIVLAQPIVTGDFVNELIVPGVTIFVLAFGLFSLARLPKYLAGIMGAGVTGLLVMSGVLTSISSIILKMGSLLSTLIYIVLFFVGAMFISRSDSRKGKQKIAPYQVRGIQRKQIATTITQIEKRLAEVENKLKNVKIRESNLELTFSQNKSPQVIKELERVRKMKNDLALMRDSLLEQRDAYKRIYREATG